jgi:hypothetical protein
VWNLFRFNQFYSNSRPEGLNISNIYCWHGHLCDWLSSPGKCSEWCNLPWDFMHFVVVVLYQNMYIDSFQKCILQFFLQSAPWLNYLFTATRLMLNHCLWWKCLPVKTMDDVLVHGLFLSCFHSSRDLLGYRLHNSTLQIISFSSFMSNTEL